MCRLAAKRLRLVHNNNQREPNTSAAELSSVAYENTNAEVQSGKPKDETSLNSADTEVSGR